MSEENQAIEETVEPVQDAQTEATAETVTEAAPVESEDTSAPEPEKSGVQKRIDQLTWRLREAERRAEQAERQSRQEQPQPSEPKLEDFSDYDAYIRAQARWEAKQELNSWQAQQQQARQQAEAQQRAQSYRMKAEQFAAEHADYDAVVTNPYLPITQEMSEVIQSSDAGPAIAYHLGNNPQEAARIAQLSPVLQAAALGKLEARLTAPKQKKVTNAPPPIQAIGGGEAGVKDPSKMTTEQFIAWRNAQSRQ